MHSSTLIRRAFLGLSLAALTACTVPTTGPGQRPVDPDQPVTVALLVPTGSGDAQREALGQALVNAAQLAQSDLAGIRIDLKVYATGGEIVTAGKAAELALADGAQIIVGPLFADATTAVAPIAAAKGVNVLSFSNNSVVAGGNVYLLGLTFGSIADRIVRFAAARGLSEFGIVHPEGIEGEAARDAVRRAAASAGVRVAAEGSYPLSVQGISETASGIAQRMRGAGVNALVLTDGPTGGLPFISETLRGLGVRAGSVQFLGLQPWDASAEAIRQPGLQGGWFAAPDTILRNQFNNRYLAAYGQDAHPLAALAYDGIAAVGALVSEARAEGRNDPFTAERLTKSAGFAGVNGVFRFRPDGQNERALAIFEVIEGEARVIDPAPTGFAAGSGS